MFNHFFLTTGALQIALNGEDFKEFLTGIPTNIPLWIMFEVYGPTTSIQMIGTLL